MWAYQNPDENVVSPTRNHTEEVTSRVHRVTTSALVPIMEIEEDDRTNAIPSISSATQPNSGTIPGVEPNSDARTEPLTPSRRSPPIPVRPLAWRRRIYLPPLIAGNMFFSQIGCYRWPREEGGNSDSEEDVLGAPDSLRASAVSTGYNSVDMLLFKSLESYVLSVQASIPVMRPSMTQLLWERTQNISRLENSSSADGTADNATQTENRLVIEERVPHSLETNRIITPVVTYDFCLPTKKPPLQMPAPRRRQNLLFKNMPVPSLMAKLAANRIIKYARDARNIHEEEMCCLNCGSFPVNPVTGRCGHTRCTKCIELNAKCPCGKETSQPLNADILIRSLHDKSVKYNNAGFQNGASTSKLIKPVPANVLLSGARWSNDAGNIRAWHARRAFYSAPANNRYIPMSARARFAYAVELLQNGKHKEAAPHLAIAAASYHPDMREARPLLAQVITALSKNREPRGLTRELNRMVRHLTSMSWIKAEDLECILCCDIYVNPVTTPCGHTFCRTCLEKTIDYRKPCPLCQQSFGDFKLRETEDTKFLKGALAAIDALNMPKPMEEEDLVPIFVCTVAYPSVPCPLFIFDPRYWLMIRRVLESGSRRFGMVTLDRGKKYADYGTILEVRDCVQLEDGRSILSTIGLSRFKVIERSVRDGCEVARILPIHDIPPDSDFVAPDELKMYASRIMLKAVFWLSQLGPKVLSDIENAFGTLPSTREEDENEEWWESSDGPAWLWWLVAVLPLRAEIKVLILSTDCLIKRMMAVARTLEAVSRTDLTTVSPEQCEIPETINNDIIME